MTNREELKSVILEVMAKAKNLVNGSSYWIYLQGDEIGYSVVTPGSSLAAVRDGKVKFLAEINRKDAYEGYKVWVDDVENPRQYRTFVVETITAEIIREYNGEPSPHDKWLVAEGLVD